MVWLTASLLVLVWTDASAAMDPKKVFKYYKAMKTK